MINVPKDFFTSSKHPFKTLLISGGHGSSDFIKKIWEKEVYKKNIQIKVLFNPFDDGASYGIIRDKLGVSCLGDGRKNQYNMFLQLYGDKLPDYVKEVYYLLFEKRHSFPSSTIYIDTLASHVWTLLEAHKHHVNEPYHFTTDGIKILHIIFDSLKHFAEKVYTNTPHNSFNLSNMFYGIMELYSTSSLQALLDSISHSIFCLGPNSVITSLNDSARLISKTEKGMTLSRETPDIIDFKNVYKVMGHDNIVDQNIIPFDNNFNLNYYIDNNTKNYILNCDLMLICPGTLYSSLNPTFLNNTILELVKKSNSKKYMYINDIPDNDFMINDYSNLDAYYRNSIFSKNKGLIDQFTLLYKHSMNNISGQPVLKVNYDKFLYSLLSYYFFDKLVDLNEIHDSNLILDYDGTIYSSTDSESTDALITIINDRIDSGTLFISTGNYVIREHNVKLKNSPNIFLSNVYNPSRVSDGIDFYAGFLLNKDIVSHLDKYEEIYPIEDLLYEDRHNDIVATIKHVNTHTRHLISSDLNRKLINYDIKHEQKHILTYCLGKTSIDFIYSDYLKQNLNKFISLELSIYIGDGVNNPYSNDSKIANRCKYGVNVKSLVETLLFLEIIT